MKESVTAGVLKKRVNRWLITAMFSTGFWALQVIILGIVSPKTFGDPPLLFSWIGIPMAIVPFCWWYSHKLDQRLRFYEAAWEEALKTSENLLEMLKQQISDPMKQEQALWVAKYLLGRHGIGPYDLSPELSDILSHRNKGGWILSEGGLLYSRPGESVYRWCWELVYREHPLPDDWFPGKSDPVPTDPPDSPKPPLIA
jgi:hypothetical protein